MVPQYKRQAALIMFESYINDKDLPRFKKEFSINK